MSRIAPQGGSFFKIPTYRNKELLGLARLAPRCMSCGRRNDGTVVSAHSNQGRDGHGRSIKAQDFRIAFLDRDCHFELDQGKSMTREQRVQMWEDAHRATIAWLFESGHLQVVP